jgi:triosephosphate isomerase
MRKLVIAGNWKMNKTEKEGVAFVEELKKVNTDNFTGRKMIFAPSIMLKSLVESTKGSNIEIGAQNMHQAEAGAYTGEVSADMLVDLGIKNILIGHSERRQYFNETDKIVNEKLHLAINKGLNAVVCVGETKDEREAGITNTLLKTQTTKAFEEVAESDAKNVIIAYEPVWAIGTGLVATNEEANEACAYIRSVIADMYSQETADTIIIQYGGSVTPATVADLMGQSDIDGALVGGASLVVDSYVDLLV